MIFALEGGYDALALSDNLQASLAALCGDEKFSDHYGKGPDQSRVITPMIDTVLKYHHL